MKRIFVVGAICLALSACTGTPDAGVSPSVAVTTAGTPMPSVSDPALDPLYLEAVEVYEKYLVVLFKLDRGGGAPQLPREFDEFVVGTYRDALETLYKKYEDSGEHMAATPDPTLRVRPLVGVTVEGAEVALEVCVDATAVNQLDANGKLLHKGTLAHRQVFFARQDDGALKMIGAYGEAVVKCPF